MLSIIMIFVTVMHIIQCTEKQKVLLISFSGFRPDYVEIYDLIGFKYLAKMGVHSRLGMKPSFPTKRVPNLYTIVTGLYSENHGIIDNTMWDPDFNETFHAFQRNPKWWQQGEPIWITAKQQGKKTAVYSWPGGTVKIHGLYPDFVLELFSNTPFKDEIDTIIDWFGIEDLDLIVVNVADNYYRARFLGTYNEQVIRWIQESDVLIEYLMYRLAIEALIDKVNVIVVSDHGLINVTQDSEHIINLSNYINEKNEIENHHLYSGGSLGIWPKPGREVFVYKKLSHAHSKMKVYTKKNIPDHFHIKNNKRCPPIWVFAEEGYIIKTRTFGHEKGIRGVDGYSNEIIDTRAVFYASGPSFKQNYTINEFEAVNIYLLICHILDIRPAPNNGSLEVVREMLEISQTKRMTTDSATSIGISLELLIITNSMYYLRDG